MFTTCEQDLRKNTWICLKASIQEWHTRQESGGDENCHLDYNQLNDFFYEGSVKGKEFNYKNFGVLLDG